MAKLDFSGPLLKVERADHHINQLEDMLRRYVVDNRQRFRPERQQRALKQGRRIDFAKPAKHTPTILGDALHNLRVALDHAYCVLIQANRHTPTDFSRFPFSKDWPSMKGSIKGHIQSGNGPSLAALDYIGDEIEPFPGGKHRLFDLHQLDIADKHQALLPTMPYAHMSKVAVAGPDGRVRAHIESLTVIDCPGLIKGGTTLFENQMQNAFDVTFGEGQPFAGEPILPSIKRLRNTTCDTLKGLSSFL